MAMHEERYIVDAAGNRIAVVLDIEGYHRLLATLEDLDDRCAYDEAAAANDEAVPLEEALAEIERERRCRTPSRCYDRAESVASKGSGLRTGD